MAETPKTIRKQAIERIRRKAGEACIAIREEAERLILAIEWEETLDPLDRPLDPPIRPLDPDDRPLDPNDPPDIRRGMRATCTKCHRLYPPDAREGSDLTHCGLCNGLTLADKPLVCCNPTPKGCTSPYHAPECEGNGVSCKPAKLICRTCEVLIDHGNCCSEECTKKWIASTAFLHDDRLCFRCGQPHALKHNYCGPCALKNRNTPR